MSNKKNLRIKCISPLFFPHPKCLEKILWLRVAKLVTDFSARSLNSSYIYNFIKYCLFFLFFSFFFFLSFSLACKSHLHFSLSSGFSFCLSVMFLTCFLYRLWHLHYVFDEAPSCIWKAGSELNRNETAGLLKPPKETLGGSLHPAPPPWSPTVVNYGTLSTAGHTWQATSAGINIAKFQEPESSNHPRLATTDLLVQTRAQSDVAHAYSTFSSFTYVMV